MKSKLVEVVRYSQTFFLASFITNHANQLINSILAYRQSQTMSHKAILNMEIAGRIAIKDMDENLRREQQIMNKLLQSIEKEMAKYENIPLLTVNNKAVQKLLARQSFIKCELEKCRQRVIEIRTSPPDELATFDEQAVAASSTMQTDQPENKRQRVI